MGSPLQWVAAAPTPVGRQITMPYGLGDTTDLTNALSVLKLAGLRAVVETHDTIRLADGRRARFPTLTQRPRNDDPNDAELLLLAPRTVTTTQIALAEQTATVLLVDIDRRRVGSTADKPSGRRNGGRTPPRSTSRSPSRGCSPSTAPPSTSSYGPGSRRGRWTTGSHASGNACTAPTSGGSRQVGGLVDFAIACYPDPAARPNPMDIRPAAHRASGTPHRRGLSHLRPLRSPTAPATQPSVDARCRTVSSHSPSAKSTWSRSASNPTRSASQAPNSSGPPTNDLPHRRRRRVHGPDRRHHHREHVSSEPITATPMTRPRCKKSGTGCNSSPTPATTCDTTCRAETLCMPTQRRPFEAAP